MISLHTYNHHRNVQRLYSVPNYYSHDHHTGEGGNGIGYFVNAGSKKLQQSSNYLPDDEGVKFLPIKRYFIFIHHHVPMRAYEFKQLSSSKEKNTTLIN